MINQTMFFTVMTRRVCLMPKVATLYRIIEAVGSRVACSSTQLSGPPIAAGYSGFKRDYLKRPT